MSIIITFKLLLQEKHYVNAESRLKHSGSLIKKSNSNPMVELGPHILYTYSLISSAWSITINYVSKIDQDAKIFDLSNCLKLQHFFAYKEIDYFYDVFNITNYEKIMEI